MRPNMLYHPLLAMKETLFDPIYRGTAYLRSKLGGFSWGPARAVAKSAVLSLFSSVKVGSILLIDEPAHQRYHFGQKHRKKSNWNILDKAAGQADVACPTCAARESTTVSHVELVVKSDSFWTRLFLFADMGFAEAYMLGEVECTDLTAFFKLFILNRDRLGNGTTWSSVITNAVLRLARSTNTMSNSLLNTSSHYDISNDMFAAFLSPDMTYSCPIWQPLQPGVKVRDTLEQAQMKKLHRFIEGARIKATDHVLEIGSGWGSFAIEAVRMTGCRVTTLTLSREQKALAEKRIAEAWCSNRIQVLLADYRELPVPETLYDKIISIEMLEAVGREYLGTYFSCVNRLLKREGGIAMFQCITMPEGRHEAYSRTEDFINHYIFPGGYLPSITQLLNHITTESKGTLIVEKVENIGGHYARALRLWRERFLATFNSTIRPALKKEHPDMGEEEIEVFRRKWEYYFSYSEAGFLTKTLGDVIITVGREGAKELMEDIPV